MNHIHDYCKRISRLACDINGDEFEIDRCMEEMAELTKALLKGKRYDTAWETVLSEMGDVILTLHHIQTAYGFSDDEIIKSISHSIDRLIEEQPERE